MIQETDLRIGNYVLYSGHYRKIVSLNLGTDVNAEPIPLSEELLLKCGAINKFGRTYFIGKIKFDINTLNIVRFHYSGKVAYIYYLHQLQNLWYSLYNEELQINL